VSAKIIPITQRIAERLTSHAIREFRAASRFELVTILGVAVHVANRISVDQALADMGGAA